ncbi:hypothetical protein diail_4622 [Diaporthe ilicicola]|nr:hypothetical protein diail_4622 [Diaporthe ilicicola]
MFDIKDAGVMGKGVFANRAIPSGITIGEYLGRLHPLNSLKGGDMYIFLLDGAAEVTCREYGNFTRFVNHHCNPNVNARLGMYGKRRAIFYTTNRDIKQGEQIFISYGREYFKGSKIFCKCDGHDGDHLPGDPKAAVARKLDAVQAMKALQAAKEVQDAENQEAEVQRTATAADKSLTEKPLQEAIKPVSSPRSWRAAKAKRSRRNKSSAPSKLTRSAAVSKRYISYSSKIPQPFEEI